VRHLQWDPEALKIRRVLFAVVVFLATPPLRRGLGQFQVDDVVGADNLIRPGQATCSYSCRTPPRRSRRRMSRWAIESGSVIDSGNGCSGRALEIPRWGRWVLWNCSTREVRTGVDAGLHEDDRVIVVDLETGNEPAKFAGCADLCVGAHEIP
jgi:hypothetical protein